MFSKQQQQQLQQHGFNGLLSGGTSLRLITGRKDVVLHPSSTFSPPYLTDARSTSKRERERDFRSSFAPRRKYGLSSLPLLALPPHLLPARQAHHSFPLPTLATTTTNPPTGNINADNPLLTILTNILAPSPKSPASSPSGSSKSPSLSPSKLNRTSPLSITTTANSTQRQQQHAPHHPNAHPRSLKLMALSRRRHSKRRSPFWCPGPTKSHSPL
ncbi:hypothetical protein M407DRAFT_31353 [Tulasnella calospora MUT 4182]|uniref:Uncharacterized protein n=1 Tax=Tulasnella calospora MUT 4182 TaxID=1051891 RepID=A0A0C3KC19_9AGAM|nr:hypothetical protein M407DRAFT_31353 [Tulasnella calospora MUT 4182]